MKKIFLPVFFGYAASAFAQDHTNVSPTDSAVNENHPLVRIISVSGNAGSEFYSDGYEDRSVFQQAVPGSTLAFADVSGYTNYNGMYRTVNSGGAMTGLQVNFRLRCQKQFSELRAGITHSYVSISSQSYSLESRTPVDTTVMFNGQMLITDSVAISSFNYNWTTETMQLHVGWIARSSPRRWINIYTGLGLFFGLGYNGTIRMTHEHDFYYEGRAQGGSYYYSSNYQVISHSEEYYRAPMVRTYGVYMPVGMNIVLSRWRPFLSHIALCSEYDGGLVFVRTSDGLSKIRTTSGITGGIRWYVKAPAKEKGRRRPKDRGQYSHGEEHLQHN